MLKFFRNYVLGVVQLIFLLISGCGSQEKKENCQTNKDTFSPPSNSCPSELKDGSSAPKFALKGSVTAAFEVVVDGNKYADIESFYTAEKSKLPEKAKAAGFDGWDATFEAQIGYNDLVLGMVVFIQSTGKRGYAGKGLVEADGNFSVEMPGEAVDDTYMVKSNKRVSIVLKKANETKKFCYNFAAVDLSVPYAEKDKPIVLNTFKSTLTAYECGNDPDQGFVIPKSPTEQTAGSTGASTGTSTSKGLYTFGQDVGINSFGNGSWTNCSWITSFANTWGVGRDGLIYGQPNENSDPAFPKTRNEACARAAFQNAANDKYALSIIGAMEGIKRKNPLKLLFEKGTELARTLDKSTISSIDLFDLRENYGGVNFLSGQKYALLAPYQPNDKAFYQLECSAVDIVILGFQAENFRYLYPYQLSPIEGNVVIEFVVPSKATYSCPTNIREVKQTSIWKSGDGELFKSSYSGKNALIKADGSVCYDSLNDKATESWIRAAGPTIKCE